MGTGLQTSQSRQAGWEGEGSGKIRTLLPGIRGARRAHVSSTRARALAKHLGAGPAAHRHSAPLSHAAACCTLHSAAPRSPLPSPPLRAATLQDPQQGGMWPPASGLAWVLGTRECPLLPLSSPGNEIQLPPLSLALGGSPSLVGGSPPFSTAWGGTIRLPHEGGDGIFVPAQHMRTQEGPAARGCAG